MSRSGRTREFAIAAIGLVGIAVVGTALYSSLPRQPPSAEAAAISATSAPDDVSASAPSTTTEPVQKNGDTERGLSQEEAVTAAREFLDVENREAEVWASLEGSFAEVSSRLVISPPYLEQPPSENAAPDREVWGVQFKVAVELCPPEGGGECEARTGLRAIIVDHETGEWIRTSTYAPSPGEPLPPPQN